MPRHTLLTLPRKEAIAAEDYAENMFKDGHNRAERDEKVHHAPAYDAAAHRVDADLDMPTDTESPLVRSTQTDTFHSREGTDAAGSYDETGGSLGGTEEEIDAMEVAGTPVDRSPRMKD